MSVTQLYLTLCDPWTHRTPLSTDSSRQESWSGVPFPSQIRLSSLNQPGLGCVLNLMTGVLVREDTEIQRDTERRLYEEGGRGLELCCYKPRNARSHDKLKEARNTSPLEIWKDCHPA